jgi:hypothetical protein
MSDPRVRRAYLGLMIESHKSTPILNYDHERPNVAVVDLELWEEVVRFLDGLGGYEASDLMDKIGGGGGS